MSNINKLVLEALENPAKRGALDSAKNTYEMAKDKAQEILDRAREHAKNLSGPAKDSFIQSAQRRVDSAISVAKNMYQNVKDSIRERFPNIVSAASSFASKAAEKIRNLF